MLVFKHEWSLYLGHLCVNTCSPHTLKKEEFTVYTVCENVSLYVTKLPSVSSQTRGKFSSFHMNYLVFPSHEIPSTTHRV
jgi:hypothetical protein